MKNVYTILAVVLVITFGVTHGVSAEIFQCAFLQDKYRSGKPNKAACAMSPEKVFSTQDYTPPKHEHCKVEPVYGYEDLEEVAIDLSKGTVSWTEASGLTEYAKPIQKQYYMEQGENEEEATRKANAPKVQKFHSFRIFAHERTNRTILVDEITEKRLD